jgi:hypothetical protein
MLAGEAISLEFRPPHAPPGAAIVGYSAPLTEERCGQSSARFRQDPASDAGERVIDTPHD